METTVQELRNKLSEIEFYKQRFPIMTPFVGDYYLSDQHKKMLLVGESFYFPKASTIHKDATKWYNSTQEDLGVVIENGEEVEEKDWINCNALLNSEWEAPGHKIYKELNKWIGNTNLRFNRKPIHEMAFTNFFVRPALKGQSIEKYKKKERTKDIEMANIVFKCVLNVLQPDVVIFVSKFAYQNVDKQVFTSFQNITEDYVCHPGSICWNCEDCKHNRKYFGDILNSKFVN